MGTLRKRFFDGSLLLCCVAGCAGTGAEVPAAVVRATGDEFITAGIRPAGGGNAGGLVRVIDIPTTSTMQVQVEATGLPPGPHAWHIHTGTCAQPGSVVVPFTPIGQREGIDEAITAAADGRATEDAVIPGALLTRQQLTASPHIVNIHAQGGASPGPGIACAELR